MDENTNNNQDGQGKTSLLKNHKAIVTLITVIGSIIVALINKGVFSQSPPSSIPPKKIKTHYSEPRVNKPSGLSHKKESPQTNTPPSKKESLKVKQKTHGDQSPIINAGKDSKIEINY